MYYSAVFRRVMKKKEAEDLVSGINFSYVTPYSRDRPIEDQRNINKISIRMHTYYQAFSFYVIVIIFPVQGLLRRRSNKKLKNFVHICTKWVFPLPNLPSTLVWTKISLYMYIYYCCSSIILLAFSALTQEVKNKRWRNYGEILLKHCCNTDETLVKRW